ncbi:hypothetical protein ACTFIZ_004126 [Dictyostelium cf. discoideum]
MIITGHCTITNSFTIKSRFKDVSPSDYCIEETTTTTTTKPIADQYKPVNTSSSDSPFSLTLDDTIIKSCFTISVIIVSTTKTTATTTATTGTITATITAKITAIITELQQQQNQHQQQII